MIMTTSNSFYDLSKLPTAVLYKPLSTDMDQSATHAQTVLLYHANKVVPVYSLFPIVDVQFTLVFSHTPRQNVGLYKSTCQCAQGKKNVIDVVPAHSLPVSLSSFPHVRTLLQVLSSILSIMTTITDEELYLNAEVLKGKVVLITGASSGVGQATAVSFASYGAKVIIGDVDLAGAKHTVRECLRVGGTIGSDAMVQKCDVTSWEEQVALFEAGYKKYGRIDYVIPNAGIVGDGPLALSKRTKDIPNKPDTRTIDINLVGVIYTIKLGQHYLMKNKPLGPMAIIFVGSMAGNQGFPRAEIYSATKHGLIGLCRSLTEDYRAQGIRTAVVCPWFVDTPLIKTDNRVILAGAPFTPINRVAGAIVCAATDPNWETSGASYNLPDDGPVMRTERHELSVGVYKILTERINTLIKVETTINRYMNIVSDLFMLAAPHLTIVAFVLPILAYWLFTRWMNS